MGRQLLSAVATLLIFMPTPVRAEPMREFIMSCSYGVLAGTLVGAATLAFTDKPGDNLNKVARGASLGLYAGMLLGAYVIYGVPSGQPEDDMSELATHRGFGREIPRMTLLPLFSEKGLEGAALNYSVLRF